MFSVNLSEPQQELFALCSLNPIPIDRALFLIAKDEDPLINEQTIQQLDLIAQRIHIPDVNNVLDSISRLNHYFFVEEGFTGDTDDYYNPQNSLLHKVIERKKGLPILLSLLYMEIARRLGLDLQGIGFPKHFLIRSADYGSRRFYIDTFDEGNILLEGDLRSWHQKWSIDLPFDECILPSSNRSILLRVCNNLFYAHNRLHNNEGMLRSINRLMVLEPEFTQLHRTRSVVLGKLRRYEDSLNALQNYMLFHPEASDLGDCQREVEILLQLSKKHR